MIPDEDEDPCQYCPDHAPADEYYICPKCGAEWVPEEEEDAE